MFTNLEIKIINKSEEKDSFFCDLCRFPLQSYDDFKYHREYACCTECYLTYAEARRKDWKDGWRPNQTAFEEYIYNRKQLKKARSKHEF